MTLGIYVEVLQRWFGDIDGFFARGKILYPDRGGYSVIIPTAIMLCSSPMARKASSNSAVSTLSHW